MTIKRGELLIHVPIEMIVEEVAPTARKGVANIFRLTKREQDVLNGMRRGLAHKEIGTMLNLSERTIKFHAGNIYTKMGTGHSKHDILRKYGLTEEQKVAV
jgi:DNA-binding NarL/FixJ family response regulator